MSSESDGKEHEVAHLPLAPEDGISSIVKGAQGGIGEE
jgi:hypothetical protein